VTSRIVVILTVAATAAAGIIPLLPNPPPLQPYWTSIFVAVASTLVLIDSSFTLSSSWIRYMISEEKIERVLEEFQFDWEVTRASWDQTGPNSHQVTDALARLKQAALQVSQIVQDETSIWAAELRAGLKNAAETKLQIPATAGVNVILTNGDKVKGEWSLEVDDGEAQNYSGVRAALAGLKPGVHKFRVEGKIGDQIQKDEVSAQISPSSVCEVKLILAPWIAQSLE
jgi:hypothetical protein